MAELGSAAEGLRKILEFAETVEDRFERARINDAVEQFYVLYFSPRLTKSLLEQVVKGGSLDRSALTELRERLVKTERPVNRALVRIRLLGERYRHLLTPDQWHSLEMISVGKLEIRRLLAELILLFESGDASSAQVLAAKLLDDMNSVNTLMDRTVSTVREVVEDTRHLTSKGVRLSFWLVMVMFIALWAAVSVTVILAASPLIEMLRNLAG